MKKLISKTQQKKIQQRNQLIAGSILVLLMVFSTVAYSFMDNNSSSDSSSSSLVYNGVSFSESSGYYVGEKYGYTIILSNNPKEQLSFPVNMNLSLSDYSGKPLYISSDDYLSSAEINQNFGSSFNNLAERVQMACYLDENCTQDYPIKDCQSNLVVVRYSNQSGIESFGNCTFIYGPEENITYITDKFIMNLFQI